MSFLKEKTKEIFQNGFTGFQIMLLAVFCMLAWIFLKCVTFDTDGYFLVATGKYILNNGIPNINPFSVADIPFVCQQWLWCVWLALWDFLGNAGYFLCTLIVALLLVFTIYKFTYPAIKDFYENDENLTVWIAVFAAVFSAACAAQYMASVRPEGITVLLLFLQMYATEQYLSTNKSKWLLALPILVLIESNVHMSMCAMHFLILVVYLIPAFRGEYQRKIGKPDLKKIVATVVLMCISTLVNPYGIKGVLYTFESLTSNTFTLVSDISEMQNTIILGCAGFSFIWQFVMYLILISQKKASVITVYLSPVLLIMQAMTIRNYMFAPITAALLLRDFLKGYESNAQRFLTSHAVNVKTTFPVFTALLCLYIGVGQNVFVITEAFESPKAKFYQCVDWLDDRAAYDDYIYTGFNVGAYLEYRGYTNVFIDARPEIYNSTDSKTGMNPLEIYYIFCNGCDLAGNVYTYDDIEGILAFYDFDYFIIQPEIDTFLASYLEYSGEYRAIGYVYDSGGGIDYILVQKTGFSIEGMVV